MMGPRGTAIAGRSDIHSSESCVFVSAHSPGIRILRISNRHLLPGEPGITRLPTAVSEFATALELAVMKGSGRRRRMGLNMLRLVLCAAMPMFIYDDDVDRLTGLCAAERARV
jgi:hypothetical protein